MKRGRQINIIASLFLFYILLSEAALADIEMNPSQLRPLANMEKIQPNPTPGDWSEEDMKLMKAYGLGPNTESLLPQDCGELEVLGEKVERTDLLINTVLGHLSDAKIPVKAHFVSVPVKNLPVDLTEVLKGISLTALSGKIVNVYDYLLENVDEIIFAPYYATVDRNGHVFQAGGVTTPPISSVIDENLLKTSQYRPGKVFYLPVARLVTQDRITRQVVLFTELGQLPILGFQKVKMAELIRPIMEEAVHLETIRLVVNGQLHSKYYDPPGFNWYEKAAKTVELSSLDSIREALRKILLPQDVEGFMEVIHQNIVTSLRRYNTALGLAEDDMGYLFLTMRPGPLGDTLKTSYEVILSGV